MRFGPGPRHAASKSDGARHVYAARHIRIARRSSIWRRWGRSRAFTTASLVLALVGALTLSVKALGPQAPDPQASPTALLGAWVKGSSSAPSSQLAATHQLEAAIGRKLAIGHTYVPWGQGLGSLPVSHVAEGRIPMISFGGGANPRAVAAGSYDTYLKSLARSVGALGRPVLLRYAWGVDRPIRRTAVAVHRVRVRGGLAACARPVRRPGRRRLLGVGTRCRRVRRRARRRGPVLARRPLRRLDRGRRLQRGRLQRRPGWQRLRHHLQVVLRLRDRPGRSR